MTFSRDAIRPIIEINTVDVSDVLRIRTIERSLGAGRVDTVRLIDDLGAAGRRLVDLQIPTNFDATVEIWIDRDFDPSKNEPHDLGPGDTPLFWGKIVRQHLTYGGDEESVELVARAEGFYVGAPLHGVLIRRPDDLQFQAHLPFVLNPEFLGKTVGNRSSAFDDSVKFRLFLDPASIRTEEARISLWSSQEQERWTLRHAIEHLAWRLNPNEVWVRNPESADLDLVPGIDDEELIRNHVIADGLFLFDCLDALLNPYGYSWFLKPERTDGGFVSPKITFVKKNVGTEKTVLLQRPGARLDLALTQVAEFDLDMDLSRVRNQAIAVSSRKRVEIGFEPVKTWPEADDATDFEKLDLGTPESLAKPRVWREWALNEAGDYNGTRPEITAEFDLDDIFLEPSAYPHRRKLLPCLTKSKTDDSPMGPGGVVVQWLRPDTQEWEQIPPHDAGEPSQWSYEILEHECGIRFTGKSVPQELHEQGADAVLRITATVEADVAVKKVSAPSGASPLAETVPLFLDLSARYHHKFRDASSSFDSSDKPSDDADDGDLLQSYVNDLQGREELAVIAGRITLEGLDHDFELGDLVTKVQGREINLNRRVSGTPVYPQIVGIIRNVEHQVMELVLEAFEPFLQDPKEKRPQK